jgi:hypothetical protein
VKYFSLEHKKFLVEHFVFDAWQFIDNAAKGVATTEFCCNTVRKLIEQSNEEYLQWQNNMFSKLFDGVKKDGKAHVSLRYDDMPSDVVNFLGDQISRSFLVDKYIKDFFQYARNTFDSLAQITNVALLANNAKNIEKVDFVKIENALAKPLFSGDFPDTQAFFERIKASDEFIYLAEFNNRIKHICDSELVLSHNLLNDEHTSQISAFYKKGQQFKKENILDIVEIICNFVKNEFNTFLETITKDIKNDKYINGRIHSVMFHAQHIKDDPFNSFAVVYINVVSNMDELPNEIRILLINNNDEDVLVSNCEYETILVRDASERYIGKFVIKDDIIIDDTLHKYVKYEKVKCDGMMAFFEEIKKSILIKPTFMGGIIVQEGNN